MPVPPTTDVAMAGAGADGDPASASDAEVSAEVTADIDADIETYDEALDEIIEMVDRVPPGSAHAIDSDLLERFESNDIHTVLAAVPGVFIREEDGYGLRPNIGMRGTDSNRSAKIALMEDGVLIAPAPYSAPAAYYFPLITRMRRIEVLKGPAAIQHGPNTVGGALNLITAPIPRHRELALDVAGGTELYGKAHVRGGDTVRTRAGLPDVGWLLEGVKLRTDGFKELDGGGDTGFDKNSVMGKLRLEGSGRGLYHQLSVKLGYSDEVSNETYTGLTDDDFADNPYRRYSATQLDRMRWRHTQAQISHRVQVPGVIDVTATAYRHDFTRAWRKLNGFNSATPLGAVLAAPSSGNNGVFYAVLTGNEDTLTADETLIITTNDRTFVSQGAQLVARAERSYWGTTHAVEAGLRLHYDEVERLHYDDGYDMRAGELVRDMEMDRTVDLDSLQSSTAWAGHLLYRLSVGDVRLTGGVRGEYIATHSQRFMVSGEAVAEDAIDNDYAVFIPGGGAVWQLSPALGLLVGVHKGFAPVSPGQAGTIEPENSVNYEAGLRWADFAASVEVIGFFSDYQNLLGTCSFSSGCMSEQIGEDFSGGEVHTRGVEALASYGWRPGVAVEIPLSLSYTYQRAEFQTSFSSDNPLWGEVAAGDELPYLPAHQVQLQAGVRGALWELAASGRYIAAMRDIAGQGPLEETERTDAAMVVDLAASYSFQRWGKLYLNFNNLLDEVHVTSRRPYGARPGVPRQIVLGYKATL